MDDTELVARARDGDEVAFRALYDANVDRIYRLAYRMAGDDDLAREFTQETFIRAYQNLGQFRGDAAFSSWLHSIGISSTLNGLRKLKRHWSREVDLEVARPLGTEESSLEPDLRERLHAAIDRLSEIYRTVFLMHDLEGYTHEEIAQALNVAVGTSKARLSRARALLRESLGEFAEECV